MRLLLATLFVAGCSFEHGVLELEPDAQDPGTAPTVDSGPALTPTCKYPDAELRLCIEFDDRVFAPAATDASPYRLDASASQIHEATRGTAPAAATTAQSSLTVAETAMLDIRGAITFESWLRVPAYQNATAIWNQGQYAIGLDIYGRVSCWIGSLSATASQSLGTDTWRHVACVYDGEVLSLFVDGDVARCEAKRQAIPTSGKNGTRLAGLVGAIDDVRIYARALGGAEICSHADKTACRTKCDSSGPGPGLRGDE